MGTQIDIAAELNNIAAQCPNGEDVRNGEQLHSICRRASHDVNRIGSKWTQNACRRVAGEKLIQLASDSLVTEILIHPQVGTLKQCMRNLLASFTRHRHIVHAGYTLSGTGSWLLQVRAL